MQGYLKHEFQQKQNAQATYKQEFRVCRIETFRNRDGGARWWAWRQDCS